MKAAVWFGKEDVRLVDIEAPRPGPTDVLIRPEWCAICGSDLHMIRGHFPLVSPPKTLGHEYSGTVVAVGRAVTTVVVGDRVVGGPVARCGVCHFCRTGREQLCTGATSLDGAFAEYVCIPERATHRLPDDVSMEVGSLVEPVACCVHGIEISDITVGDTVVVIGAGSIGLILAQLAQRVGAGMLVVSEPNAFRRATALKLGADIVVDPLSEDLKEVVDQATSGRGPDVVIEAIGATRTCAEAIRVAGRGATVIFFGCAPPGQRIEIEPWDLYARELVIKAVKSSPYAFRKAIPMLKQLKLEPIITHRFDLDHVHEALNAAERLSGLKVLVSPNAVAPGGKCGTGGGPGEQ